MRPKLGRLPFGKYQGQLLTDLAATDPQYLHWLLEQEWLQKHLYVLICRALDIDTTFLPHPQTANRISSPQRYQRRIVRDAISEQAAQEEEPNGKQ